MNDDFRWFDDLTLHSLQEAAIRCRFSRETLLGGLPPKLRESILTRGSPAEQLLEDLRYLNAIDVLEGGGVPLRSWLQTAEILARPRRDATVFRGAIEMLFPPGGSGAPSGRDGGGGGPRRRSSPLWSAGSLIELWRHPDATETVRIMRLYGSPKLLRNVALAARFNVDSILWEQELDQVARDLVEGSFKSSRLKGVLEVMSKDDSVLKYRGALEAILSRGL